MSPQSTRTAPERSPYRVFYWVLIAIAVVGIAALVYSVVRARTGGSAGMQPVKMDSTNLREVYARAKPEKLGRDDAPAKMVVFADFTCPYCGQWAAQVQPRVIQDYVNTGKLQLIYYDFVLGSEGEHKWSFLASRAARCAGEQGKFWEMHDHLFGTQADWTYDMTAPVRVYEGLARKVGVDGAKFDACLESDKYSDVITADRLLGNQLGIDATPTVIVNEQKLADPGLQNYDGLKRIIEQAAGGAATAPKADSAAPAAGVTTSPAGAAR